MRIFGRNGHSKPALDHPKLPSLRNIIVAKIQFSFFLFAMLVATVAQAEKRVALVIGNSAYDFNPLVNPGADATAIAELLGDLNFEVFKGLDLDYNNMTQEVGEFLNALDQADVALLYYAGHGIQLDNENYLIPTDNPLRSESDIELRSLKVSTVVAAMERSARTSITLLDACRNNPLEDQLMQSMGKSRSVALGRGLANMQAGNGSMIVFATAPNKIAFDGAGNHSPFTEALLKYMGQTDKSLSSIVTQVTADVFSATNQRQRPYTTMSLLEDVYLAKDQDSVVAPAQVAATTPAPAATTSDEPVLAEAVVRDATPATTALALADKRPSRTRDDPQTLGLSEIVDGRIGEGVSHYWSAILQPGTYQVVLDGERADDRRQGFTNFDINFSNVSGQELASKIGADGYYLRSRFTRVLEVSAETEVIVTIGGTNTVVDYDLALLPEDVETPTPYLKEPFPVETLVIGAQSDANISGLDPATSEAWYDLTLDAKDYEIIVAFSNLESATGFSGGKAEIFGPSGEVLSRSRASCTANGYDATNACSMKFSLADEAHYMVRLFAQDEERYLAGITVKELD